MKKFSSPATSSSNYRSLSLPKGRSEVTESTQKCHPERSAKHVVEGSLVAVLIAILLTACGENTTTEKIVEVATGGTEIVSSVKDLPKCTKNNEGEQALVKGESSIRVCVDGKWFATKESAKDTVFMAGDTVYLDNGNYSCTTKELKDKSGLKIICNGDSIGVVLNGAKGETGAKGDKGDAGEQGIQGKTGEQGEQGIQGEKGDTGDKGDKGDTGEQGIQGDKGDDGAGCAIVGQTDSTVTIKCGEKSVVLNLGGKGGNGGSDIIDTLELDSEKIAISLDTLSGFSQKGPFLKGSTVLLYELSDGRTLKQTNGNFTSEITSDDGRYSFQSRDLVSQYALIVVDGKYWNEVTGKPTTTNIKLQAYTNMLMRKSANVNLLTHLEKNRVFYLVTKKGMTVRAAKKQAQAEIFKQFHIDASGFKTESEDLDVFGKTDADAALLAISILLQGDSSETALSVLLTEISNDMETDGLWNEDSAAATKAAIADWAFVVDDLGKLGTYRSNVKGWGLSTTVPEFEKYIRRFASVENGLGVCGVDEKVGTVKNVTNVKSMYYSSSYLDTISHSTNPFVGKTRFICVDADSAKWRVATDIEKDTMGWGHDFKDGAVRNGRVNSNLTYVYQDKNWRKGTNIDSLIGKGCVTFRQDTVAKASNKEWYICKSNAWRVATDIEKDTATWGAGENGEVRNGQINTTTTYVYHDGNWRLGTALDSLLVKEAEGTACLTVGDTSTVKYKDVYYVCTANTDGAVRGWKVAPDIYNDTYEARGECNKMGSYGDGTLLKGRVNTDKTYACDGGEFRVAKLKEIEFALGCTSYNQGFFKKNAESDYAEYGFVCKENSEWDSYVTIQRIESKFGRLNDERDGKSYYTIKIGEQTWMAENLNLDYKVDGSTYGTYTNTDNGETYGRYYTWAAAMDSAGLYSDNSKGCGYGKSYDKTCTVATSARGICPEGWHIPTWAEWNTLYSAIGSSPYAMQAKGFDGWSSATDTYGFSALPAGYYYNGNFYYVGSDAYFWSAAEYSGNYACRWYLGASNADHCSTKDNGYSVRCIKD